MSILGLISNDGWQIILCVFLAWISPLNAFSIITIFQLTDYTYEYSGSLYSIIDDAILDYVLAGFTLDFRRRIAKTADVYDKEYNGELLRYAKIKMCG